MIISISFSHFLLFLFTGAYFVILFALSPSCCFARQTFIVSDQDGYSSAQAWCLIRAKHTSADMLYIVFRISTLAFVLPPTPSPT